MYRHLRSQLLGNFQEMYYVLATTPAKQEASSEIYEEIYEKIKEADAVLVGISAGMSSANGPSFNPYDGGEFFQKHYAPFIEKYGFKESFTPLHMEFPDRRDHWGYRVLYTKATEDLEIGSSYLLLKELLDEKPYHIINTNLDGQGPRVFPLEHQTIVQGEVHYLQCSQKCHDHVYDWSDKVNEMYEAMDGGTGIPEEMIPYCPKCGEEMNLWGRPWNFLEGKDYKESWQRAVDFIEDYADHKIVLLELGVGMMTPEFIKIPFINMTHRLPHATYIPMSYEHAIVPAHIKEKSLPVPGDLMEPLTKLVELKEKDRVEDNAFKTNPTNS